MDYLKIHIPADVRFPEEAYFKVDSRMENLDIVKILLRGCFNYTVSNIDLLSLIKICQRQHYGAVPHRLAAYRDRSVIPTLTCKRAAFLDKEV